MSLSAVLWAVLLLWACFEVLDLYVWTRRLPGEGDAHFKGRLEAIGPQARLVALGIFIGASGIAAMTLALLYSKRLGDLSDEMRSQRGRRLEVEEMGLAAAGLAHETKNPLGLMRGMAQRISSSSVSQEEARELATRIIEEADLTSSRLGDFLRYAGVRRPSLQTVEALPALERLAALMEGDFKAADVELKLSCPPLSIDADPEMLSQILVNLLVNALKFTPSGGRVELALRRSHGRTATLSVSDNGKGMPPDVVPNIFKPYFSRRPGGCGLGLAIVKRMVESSGWEIAVDSVEDRGSTISIKGIEIKQV